MSDSLLATILLAVVSIVVVRMVMGSTEQHKEQSSRQDIQPAELAAMDVTALIEAVRREAGKRRKRRRAREAFVTVYACGFAGFLAYFLVLGALTGSWGHFPVQLFQAFNVANLIYAGGLSKLHKSATSELARLDDLRAVGPLAGVLDSRDVEARNVARSAVARLLPRMTAADSHLLDSEQRKAIWQEVRSLGQGPRGLSFILAWLKACEQVADEPDAESVARLAEHTPRSPNGQVIREAAAAALPAARHRAEMARAAALLLRPASGDESAATLLRPAANAASTPEDQLLRPATANREDGEFSVNAKSPVWDDSTATATREDDQQREVLLGRVNPTDSD